MQSDLFDSPSEPSSGLSTESASSTQKMSPGVVFSGHLNKMRVRLEEPAEYRLGDLRVNDLIGHSLKLTYKHHIKCIGCGADTNKSFSQGYCYKCFTTKAACDSCIMSPEKCHFDNNTCREPGWGEQYCNQSHYVYLANSSGIKVGITRGTQVPTRWIDQGASQAIPIIRTMNRHLSGLVEVVIKQHVTDKTNWRTMLKGAPERLNLAAERDRLLAECQSELEEITNRYGLNAIQPLLHSESIDIAYPVSEYPDKVSSFNFDKEAEVSGVLKGIKGQYLIFDTGVINLRRFTGYEIDIEVVA
ncbi:DUF2797 domain-containing protein [Litoribrevibacter albus]|uniref:DUF2797 domain-containing protein n=1 Tax=Litoribrevibacter albus TaxID=1473156 RepID=A0AA37SBR2_9GAMM|nr:DUF2797 domain-containing protein [Litoribrevibacter albus]GLQ32319.1 hypothetical protein GCM10007876_27980 [Litoribrevibacter albus]